MSDQNWIEVVGVIGIFILITSVVTVTIWQLAATWRAKALLGREEAYRTLAETAARAQENTERQLIEVAGRLAALDDRLNRLERILQEVE